MNEERPALPAPGERGRLSVPAKVISKIAARSVELRGACARRPSVEVVDLNGTDLELQASLQLPYPRESLSPLLERLRDQVARDVEHQTGRVLRRLDLRVEEFVNEPRGRTPRVL